MVLLLDGDCFHSRNSGAKNNFKVAIKLIIETFIIQVTKELTENTFASYKI